MKDFLKKISGNSLLHFMLIFVAATVFYLYKLGFSDMWSDEIYTKTMLGGTLPEFFARFSNDLHPPLYYFGLRLFTTIFGTDVVAMRLFSVLGVLSALLLAYFAGQRVFGKNGALYFCLILPALPMLAMYSHQARMYTWAAFSVTGVFLYALLFIRTGSKRDLLLLLIFTLVAMYIHYYSLAAAFVANLFVFAYLLFTGNKTWRLHFVAMLLAIVLFLPWLLMFFTQVKKVQHAFWAPPVSWDTLLPCFTIPFTEQFWTSGFSTTLVILMYVLLAAATILSFTKRFSPYRLAFWLSVTIFAGTLLLVSLISLFSQPILYSRYVMAIVTMLAVPPALLLIILPFRWVRWVLAAVILFLGIRVTVSGFQFSYGPYQQTIEHISANYPEIRKILHITEVTAGPLAEYNGNSGLTHYWLKAEMSNVDAFTNIRQFNRPDEFLQPGEKFCVVRFHELELNMQNLNLVLSQSELVKKDTVRDSKMQDGIYLQLYFLKFMGTRDTIQQ